MWLSIKDSLVMTGLIVAILLMVFHSYLFFHVGVEFFSILISFSIFIFGWNTR